MGGQVRPPTGTRAPAAIVKTPGLTPAASLAALAVGGAVYGGMGFAGMFLLIAFFPFTRLVHVLVVPNMYLWRRTQVVRWYWPRHTIRKVD